MRIGALILTTGLGPLSGTAALMMPCGNVSAGQRLIAALQCGGAENVILSLGAKTKEDRQFSGSGVFFLHTGEDQTPPEQAAADVIGQLCSRYDRILLTRADLPLVLPDTVQALLDAQGDLIVPVYKGLYGCPVVLSGACAEAFLLQKSLGSLEKILEDISLPKTFLPVDDPGVIIRGESGTARQERIDLQNAQLTRPEVEVTLTREKTLLDPRLARFLHLVDETHSVRLACELLQLSYSCAWGMLNRADDMLGYPLLARNRGGSDGSGSHLTPEGRRLLDLYDGFSRELQQSARALYEDFFGDLLDLD